MLRKMLHAHFHPTCLHVTDPEAECQRQDMLYSKAQSCHVEEQGPRSLGFKVHGGSLGGEQEAEVSRQQRRDDALMKRRNT